MSDTMFDNSLLATQESMAGVDWDNLESFGTPAEGQHLATIISVKGYMQNFANYTGPRAKGGRPFDEGADKGKFVYDDINLPHGQEKDGNVKRRALITSRMGLITKGTHETVQVNWKALEGRDVLITVEHAYLKRTGRRKAPLPMSRFPGGMPLVPKPPPHLPPPDTPTFNSRNGGLSEGRPPARRLFWSPLTAFSLTSISTKTGF